MSGVYGSCEDNSNNEVRHVYVSPNSVPSVATPHPTFLEWLTLGKLTIIALAFTLVTITVVAVIWG